MEKASRSTLNPFNHQHGKPGHVPPKNFKCMVCGKGFRCKSRLIDHMRTHSDERPFKCTATDCEKAFKSERNLKLHIKIEHSDECPTRSNLLGSSDYTAQSPLDLNEPMKFHCDDQPLACNYEGCSYRTRQKVYLERHLTSVHSTNATFVCLECDYKTTHYDYLELHMHRRHSATSDNSKCSHLECAQYLFCSYDMECFPSNEDEEARKLCDQIIQNATARYDEMSMQSCQLNCEQTFISPNPVYDPNGNVYSMESLVCHIQTCSYRTRSAEDLLAHMIVHIKRSAMDDQSMEPSL